MAIIREAIVIDNNYRCYEQKEKKLAEQSIFEQGEGTKEQVFFQRRSLVMIRSTNELNDVEQS